jgi:hypothetical protein
MPWYAGLVIGGGTVCVSWDDDFERASLGADWTLFEFPDETATDPSSGQVLPIIVSGKLQHPYLGGSGGDPATLLTASVLRTVPASGDLQFITAVIHNAFQTSVTGTNFRAHVDLILAADPATGSHMAVRFSTQSGAGVGSTDRYLGISTSFYTGGTGADRTPGESQISGPHSAGAVGDANVYTIVAFLRQSTGQYFVSLGGGAMVLNEIWPVAIPWGGYQGLAVRWSNGTAVEGSFVSPGYAEASGGCIQLSLPEPPSGDPLLE